MAARVPELDRAMAARTRELGRASLRGMAARDVTMRLWDARRLTAPLGARASAVRGLQFSPDGRFLAAAEADDFVRVYDAAAGYAGAAQEAGLFGEVAGAAFGPDARPCS
ncbi:hypothetical protein U9M48_020440 [Paspalum notatum var. saurae]|uniref:Uncharacterized protein n=1 Tax=Paspalum notatum var. saurae TaxID=547442 RepID=A0AAQ3TDD0_PASNO